MSQNQSANVDITEAIQQIDDVHNVSKSTSDSQMGLETMALLIHSHRLNSLENKLKSEYAELKERQGKVTYLHKLIKSINAVTVNNEFDCSARPELKEMLAKAAEYGVEIKPGQSKFNSEERKLLIENINMTCEDYNILNDMQLQTVNRLHTERTESFQLARAIMKPLHDDKINKARAIGK